jgi:proteasome lid subunit RPN8/RPN11
MLALPADVRAEILAHAREGAPEEVVGLLAGRLDSDRSVVERIYKATNAAETPETRYEIAPAEELELLERVDEEGFEVVGFYHSHPRGPAGPSETDARLAAWSGRSYLIVSLADGTAELGSWRWSGETFEAERIEALE